MSSFYILGIDQSTQGTKAVLFDKDGKIIARADAAHKQIVNDQNWVSHDLEEIYANVIKAARQVVEKAGIDKKQIVCIGIDNQRETTAAWNRKTGKPVADAIVWQCSRAKDICRRIGEDGVSGEKVYRRTGLKLSPYYPAGKMAWFLENISGAKELAENGELALGTMDSWLVYKLTGGKEFKTDYSNASRTQLLNIKDLVWDREMCELFGIPMKALPQICDSDSTFGYTDLEGYLDKEIPICGILGDSHGALYGHNCRQAGGIKTTYGTGSSVMMNTGETPFFSEHGLGFATGIAIALKKNEKNNHVYVITGDGELAEGSNWEALMSAAKYKLDNLTWIVDRNHLQISGNTEDVMPIENLKEKAEAFGFKTIEINGHDYDEISDALDTREEGKPVCVIANTIKGKGLACAENQAGWHHKTPSLEQVEQLKEDMAEYRKELA